MSSPTMSIATTSASRRSARLGCLPSARACCADAFRATSWMQLAELADQYGNGELRTTIMQNIVIVNVPHAKTAELVVALNTHGAAGRCLGLLARRDRLHRDRVLQARDRRDQGVFEVAGQRDGRTAARLRSADQTARHRLHQQLRTALDRRHRARGQEDQEGRPDGGRLLLLRGRRSGQVRAHRAASGVSGRSRGRSGRDRAAAARLSCRSSAGGRPSGLLRPYRRRQPSRSAGRGRHACRTRCSAGRRGPLTRRESKLISWISFPFS